MAEAEDWSGPLYDRAKAVVDAYERHDFNATIVEIRALAKTLHEIEATLAILDELALTAPCTCHAAGDSLDTLDIDCPRHGGRSLMSEQSDSAQFLHEVPLIAVKSDFDFQQTRIHPHHGNLYRAVEIWSDNISKSKTVTVESLIDHTKSTIPLAQWESWEIAPTHIKSKEGNDGR